MNRLAGATSPYLLQHAENPVDWYEWGDEAFERARAEDKPLLVSVGYSSCHWCHVMAHESFESETTAALMNELFVNVKVDREERPDVDAVTMEATVGMTGSGGWPTTVFMTPDGKPFYAGTYFPPEPRHGMPSFPELLRAITDTWRERRDDIERQAERIDGALRSTAASPASSEPLTSALLAEAASGIAATFEPAFGGFGRAPKFPAASTLELLLRRGDERSLEIVTATLDGMAAGGFYDVVGGGFHRYSVDDRWLVPHFEKMLYDNAVLVSTYLHAWVVTERARYREIVEETIGYMLRELALPEGGLASAHDADTEGVEGLTYTWTPEEANEVGLSREVLEPFEHGRYVVRGELEPGASSSRAVGTRPQAAALPRRQGARVVERARARCARRGRATGSSAPTGSRPRAVSARTCSARCPLPTVASCARRATAGRAATGSSTTTRTSRTGSSSCTSRRASWAGSSRLVASRSSPSSSSPTTSTAASSSRRPTATRGCRARRTSRTRPSRRATRCSRTSSCASLASGPTTSSSGERSRSSGSPSPRSGARRGSSRGCSAGSTSG